MGLLDFIFKKKNNMSVMRAGEYINNFNINEFNNNVLASNETIFAAVNLLSNAIASAPITLRQNYKELSPAEDNIAYLLKFGLCPFCSTFEFIRNLETERNIKGSAYVIKQYNQSGQIIALLQLHSDYVKPYIDENTNDLYYQITDNISNTSYKVHSSNIIKVDYISSDYTVKGVSPVEILSNTISYNKEVENFSINQLQSGLKPQLVLTIEQSMNEEQYKKYDEMLRRFKKSGILYLDSGKKIDDLKQTSLIDPHVFEVAEITIKKVAAVYNIPISKLWPAAKTSSAEEEDLLYLKDTILPIIRMYEQAFSKGLLSVQDRMNGKEVKFNMNGFARSNMATRAEFYQKQLRNGLMSRNEIRALEDLPPIEKGDEFYISRDLINVNLLDALTLNELKGVEHNE